VITSGYFSQALFGTLTQGLAVTEDYRFELLFEQLLGGALGLCGIRAEELAYPNPCLSRRREWQGAVRVGGEQQAVPVAE
jgi:hypothetical protein